MIIRDASRDYSLSLSPRITSLVSECSVLLYCWLTIAPQNIIPVLIAADDTRYDERLDNDKIHIAHL